MVHHIKRRLGPQASLHPRSLGVVVCAVVPSADWRRLFELGLYLGSLLNVPSYRNCSTFPSFHFLSCKVKMLMEPVISKGPMTVTKRQPQVRHCRPCLAQRALGSSSILSEHKAQMWTFLQLACNLYPKTGQRNPCALLPVTAPWHSLLPQLFRLQECLLWIRGLGGGPDGV